jgi:hypothetical protein
VREIKEREREELTSVVVIVLEIHYRLLAPAGRLLVPPCPASPSLRLLTLLQK